MSDLVKRLRALVILDEVGSDNPLGREAADRIETLEVALETIADPTSNLMRDEIEEIARAALAPEQDKCE